MVLIPISLLPLPLGFGGMVYAVTAAICGAVFLLAFRLRRSGATDRRRAPHLFVFSIFYLFLLFAALLAEHSGAPSSALRSTHGSGAAAASIRTEPPICPARTACSSPGVRVDEV